MSQDYSSSSNSIQNETNRELETDLSQVSSLVMSPLKRRRNESPIWDHCITLANGDKKCNVEFCSQSWKASTSSTTIMNHLEKIHSISFKAKSGNDETTQIVNRKHCSTEQTKRTKALLEFIVESFQSFSIVNSKAFLNFCYLMDNRYTVPERHTVSSLLDKEFENSVGKLRALLSTLDAMVGYKKNSS